MVTVARRNFSHKRDPNGYCYVQLFRDVLGSKVNVRETKRIFGKFPRLRDVVFQLVRLSSGDVYVHSVVPTGLSLYHVNGSEVVLLSELVVSHMFSDALIGGYDAAEDAAIQQSDYARRIASLATVGQKNAREVLEMAAAVVFKKELTKTDSQLNQFVQDMASDSTRGRRINLPYRLSPLQLTMMQAEYPEFTLMNVNNCSHPHAVAGNLRVLAMEVLLDSIQYRKNAYPLYGEDVYAVDIGGDYLCHVKMNRMNVHCDTPVLTPRDSARETSRHLTMARMVRCGRMTKQTYDRLSGATSPCKQRCRDRSENCRVTATYGIILHAEYDISRENLTQALENHKIRVAVSAIHFDPRVFTQTDFIIESMKARVRVEDGRIHFDFTGDSSFSYSHDYKNYLDIVTCNVLITAGGRCYLVEKIGLRGATLFLRYTLCDVEPEIPAENLRCCFWLENAEETLVVATWRFQNGYYRNAKFVRTGEDDTSGRFLRKFLEVSKRFYEMVLANCLRASDKGFNLSEMLSAAISYNARLTINGQDVRSDQRRLDTDTLIDLVVACYCMAYTLRYGAGKTVEQFTTQERNKRGGNLSFLSLAGFVAQQLIPTAWVKVKWNNFVEFLSDKKARHDMTFDVSQSVRVVTLEEHVAILAKYDHHAGEAVLQTEDGPVDVLDIVDVLELKYENGKLTGVPKSGNVKSGLLNDPPSKSGNVKSGLLNDPPSSVAPSVVTKSSMSDSTLVRSASEGRKAMKKRTNAAVRAMSHLSVSEPLSEVAASALKDLRDNKSDSLCGSLHAVRMVGDGRCAFYAMLHCLGLPPSVEDVERLKEILWLSCEEQARKNNRNLLLTDFTDVNAWGTTDNFGLFSALVASDLCVHVINEDSEITTRAYSQAEGAKHAMHVRWNVSGAGHVDMYEGPTFSEDVRHRVANFVRNVQELLFNLKKNGEIRYEETSKLPSHDYINRSGLKLLSILASYPQLKTGGRVLDLCGAPGGFLSVLRKLNADVYSVSGPAIPYSDVVGGAEIVNLDLRETDLEKAFAAESCDLVLADGGDKTSYKESSLLLIQQDVIGRVLKRGGNCVLKLCNYFEQMTESIGFFKTFGRVMIEKPDFSAEGNTEVYAVCLGYRDAHSEIVGEVKVRQRLIRGLMRYMTHALHGLDSSDPRKTLMLMQILEANVFGTGERNLWRPVGLSGGAELPSFSFEGLKLELVPFVPEVPDDIDAAPVASDSGLSSDSEDVSVIDVLTLDSGFDGRVSAVISLPETLGDVDIAPTEIDSGLSSDTESSSASVVDVEISAELYNEDVHQNVLTFVDNAVLCTTDGSEAKLTWREKVGRVFGKQPKLCKVAEKSTTVEYFCRSEKKISGDGRLSNGKTLTKKEKKLIKHASKRHQDVTTSYTCHDVSVGPEGCVVGRGVVRDRNVRTKMSSRGTCVNFDFPDVDSKAEKEDEPAPEKVGGNGDDGNADAARISVVDENVVAREGSTIEETPPAPVQIVDEDRLASLVHAIETVNIPENEPLRATAAYFAVEKIRQDLLISYAWKVDNGTYKLSKCLKELTGKSTLSVKVVEATPTVCRLGSSTRVVDMTVTAEKTKIRVLVILLEEVQMLENKLLNLLEKLAECVRGKLRVSLDVLVCKDYSFDSLRVMQFSNNHLNLVFVLYLHNQYTKGRVFGSPYLYSKKTEPEMFPKLTDEDLGLVRRPTLLDDDILENRYKNAMIEYLHTSTFAQNVLAVKLRKEYDLIFGPRGVDLQALVRLSKKGIFSYDNDAGVVMSGDVEAFGWAFTVDKGSNKFIRFCKIAKRYLTGTRYLLFTRETKTLISEDIAENLRKIDINAVVVPKITWVNGPPGCGKTEFALRNHTRLEGKPNKVLGDVILTVTKESNLSLRDRVKELVEEKYLKMNYRTVASVLMNGTKHEYNKVIVDEALMMHAGAVAFAAHILGAVELILIGDKHQIPFIDRDHVTQILYANPDRFCSVSRTLNKTHRCPIDVTYLLSEKYEGFFSVSERVVSMRRERLSGQGVVKEASAVYLVFFQSDKEDLTRKGFGKVLTVHEACSLC